MHELIKQAAIETAKEINENKRIFRRFKNMTKAEIIAELQSDLAEYYLENKDTLSLKLTKLPNKEKYLKKAFINHLKDKERTKNNDFFSYLRKKIIDDFKKADEIISEIYNNFVYFSISKNPTNFLNKNLIDFDDIYYPEENDFRNETQISKKKNLKTLFFHFMDEVEKFGHKKQETAVKADDFNLWIFSNNMFEPHFVSTDEMINEIKDSNPISVISEDFKKISQKILSEFNEKEQKVLKCLLFGTSKSKLSKELGYSKPSGFTHFKDKTMDKLKIIFTKNQITDEDSEIIYEIKNLLDKD
ncbi:MAG: hypothetical protein H6680_05095 [Desulfobacteraceae bacterium]|nr:hypothetical protein [Desulfobacteraceae bacterium]